MTVYSGRFQHRVAAITGGASGVGRDAAARIAAEGGRVFLWDRDEAALAAAAATIPGAQTARVDVSD
ncbi:MAG: SDR family NAD(P)-dependent oxidoreductase, partial [Steroidobacterales bacterium]